MRHFALSIFGSLSFVQSCVNFSSFIFNMLISVKANSLILSDLKFVLCMSINDCDQLSESQIDYKKLKGNKSNMTFFFWTDTVR